ncbi:MAG: hypothetical protein GF344_09745 [Chitinivibrionales bacterium]|nr:hypothetical protein [Chitinivibrionales bacterium]MBD3357122.1 hypothetical protein [Chitinivibrionales bacterium]
MRNIIAFLALVGILLTAIGLGDRTAPAQKDEAEPQKNAVPHIGRLEVLNGCGITGAAGATADFLRSKSFDVKSIGNAETWNYPFTIVAARTKDMSIAHKVAGALGTNKCIMLRTNDTESHNVTVFVGGDFKERIE